MDILNLKFKKILAGLASFLILAFTVLTPKLAYATVNWKTGNMFLVSNTNSPAWMDPVNANVNDIVEFHLEIDNLGDETAHNVMVRADLPTGVASGSPLVTTIHVTADNAPEFVETATVNVPNTATAKSLVYFPGHAHLIKHPGFVTTSIESIGTGAAVPIGDIPAGEVNFAEVLFKAQVTESQVPTATPTQSPSATPTMTPTATPTGVPTATPTGVPSATPTGVKNITTNITCPNGNTITVNAGSNADVNALCNIVNSTNVNNNNNSNPININLSNVGGAGITTTPAPVQQTNTVSQVSELPRTGLPLAAWAFSGLLPVGLGLKKFGKQVSDTATNTPNYLWQMRQFLKKD